jgi:hypothetical protein
MRQDHIAHENPLEREDGVLGSARSNSGSVGNFHKACCHHMLPTMKRTMKQPM